MNAAYYAEITVKDAIFAAREYGTCIDAARTPDELDAVNRKLEEGLGALIAQQQRLVAKREQLMIELEARR